MGDQKPGTSNKSMPLLPNNAEAEYERALGRLTIIFSQLHFFLESFGWKVWRLGSIFGSILTGDLPIKQLVAKFRETEGTRFYTCCGASQEGIPSTALPGGKARRSQKLFPQSKKSIRSMIRFYTSRGIYLSLKIVTR